MKEKLYVVSLTKSQINNLAEFIQINIFDNIRNDTDIDGMGWLCDMCEAYTKLREIEGSIEE